MPFLNKNLVCLLKKIASIFLSHPVNYTIYQQLQETAKIRNSIKDHGCENFKILTKFDPTSRLAT